MTFSLEQIGLLNAPLSRDAVKTREQGRSRVSFVESWHVIAEANRIFGFDGWSSETIETILVIEKERLIGKPKPDGTQDKGWGVTYNAKVRVTIPGTPLIWRDGTGTGHGIDRDLGQAHESAIKEAESDAQKRAFRMFGYQFGLALYDKTQANVVDASDEYDLTRQRFIEECKASIERIGAHPDPKDLLLWWNSEPERKKRRDFELNASEVLMLTTLVKEKAKR